MTQEKVVVYAKRYGGPVEPFDGANFARLEILVPLAEGRIRPQERIEALVWLKPGSGYAAEKVKQPGIYRCKFVLMNTAGHVPTRPPATFSVDGETYLSDRTEQDYSPPTLYRYVFDSDSRPEMAECDPRQPDLVFKTIG